MNALELRDKIKGRKPEYIRQDAHKKSKLEVKWVKPKGCQSKMRHHLKGKRKCAQIGYGSPLAAKGLHASGLRERMVNNLNELDLVAKGEGAVIGSSVGGKKRLEILKKAAEKKITVLNFRDIGEYIKEREDAIKKKKEEKKNSEKKKEEKKKETEKKAKENAKKGEGLAGKITEDEKKEQEKKEKDRVLTKAGELR